MPSSYGIIVEGDFDAAVFRVLVEKIRKTSLPVYSRQCVGIANLKRNFPALLRDLEHAHHGNPVDKALVIRDADNGNPLEQEAELAARVSIVS